MKTFYVFFFVLFSLFTVTAQERVTQLLDSLVAEKNGMKIIDLNLEIASELKYKDKRRTYYYIDLAEKEAQKLNNEEAWKNFYSKAFLIYSDIDALDSALSCLLKEYDYYKNTQELKKYEIENHLGIINARLNNPDKALYYFKRILRYYERVKKYDLIAKTNNNIGLAYLKKETLDSSIYYLSKGLEAIKKTADLKIEIHLRTNIARSYSMLNEFEIAEQYFNSVMELLDETIPPGIKSWVLVEQAKFYYEKGDLDKAIDFALKAEALEPSKKNFGYAEILKVLCKSYYNKKDFEKAAYYFYKYDEVREELNIEEKAVNVEKLKIQYDYQIIEQQKEIENNRKRLNLIITICGLIIVLLILGIIMIRYKNRLEKAKLENELKEIKENELRLALELKNKELATKTIKQTEQSELINIVQKDLKEIQSKTVQSETKKALNQLVNKIKQNSYQNNWEEFELRFSNVYESFYENLNEKHPNLSPQDKRICALIRLNLSTKEIANITKTSVKSVENMRTRLRKKLDLTNSKLELSKYLSEL